MCILFKSFKTKLKMHDRLGNAMHVLLFVWHNQFMTFKWKFKICQFKLDYNILVLILIIYGRLYMQEKKPRKSTIIKVIPQLCSMLFQLYWNSNNDQQREPNHFYTLKRNTTDKTWGWCLNFVFEFPFNIYRVINLQFWM